MSQRDGRPKDTGPPGSTARQDDTDVFESRPPEVSHLAPGMHFGRYEIVSRLATGGMAEVWLAQVTSVGGFHKQVVLKTMLPHLVTSSQFTKMFIREASLAAQLNHPNIVHIFDLGETDGRLFIAMEYVAGRTFRQIRRRAEQRKEMIPHWFLLRAMIDACEGLQFAHDFSLPDGRTSGLVHRDVSPENLMVSFNGVVKVLDFGVARGSATDSLTSSGVLVGKLLYTAPERVSGIPADRRSDVYSLGVILYEYLTGSRPIVGKDEVSLMARLLSDAPRDPRELANIPDELARITMKAMAKDPAQRYQEAADLAHDLRNYVRTLGVPEDQTLASYLGSLFPESAEIPSHLKRQRAAAERVPNPVVLAAPAPASPVAADATTLVPPAKTAADVPTAPPPSSSADGVIQLESADLLNVDITVDLGSSTKVVKPAATFDESVEATVTEGLPQPSVSAPAASVLAPPALFDDTVDQPRPAEAAPSPRIYPDDVDDPGPDWTPSHPSTVFQVPTPTRGTGGTSSGDVFSVSRATETLASDVFTSFTRARKLKTPPVELPMPEVKSKKPERPTLPTRSGPPSPFGSGARAADKPPPPPKTVVAGHIERGFQHMRAGRYLQALSEWERAIELEPDNGAVRANLQRLRKRLEEE